MQIPNLSRFQSILLLLGIHVGATLLNAQRWELINIGGGDLFPIGNIDNGIVLARGYADFTVGFRAETWILKGKTNAEFAVNLDLIPLTLRTHLQKFLRKINVQIRREVVRKALVPGRQ